VGWFGSYNRVRQHYHMRTLRYILICPILLGSPLLGSVKSIAVHPDKQSISIVDRIELENNLLFIHNSDTIVVSKAIKDLSIIFQVAQLHELFFKDQGYHSISIRSLFDESKHSNKKNKYFKVEGFVPTLLNKYEWLIRLENDNARKNMILEEFIKDAKAALVEIKLQI
jgi:hypothetical protein